MIGPRPEVASLKPYHIPEVSARIILSANESPYNLPQSIIDEIKGQFDAIAYNRYPDPLSLELRTLIGEHYGLGPEKVFVGNGGDEVIQNLYLAYGGVGRKAVTFEPMFEVYGITGRMTGTEMITILRSPGDFTAEKVLPHAYMMDAALIFICCPNNPTADLVSLEAIEALLKITNALVVVDEAYAEFSGQTALPLLAKYKNLAILRTFSKAFSLAGLRAGYLLASDEVIENLLKVKLFFNFNKLSQVIARIAFLHRTIFEEKIKVILADRDRLFAQMKKLAGIEVFPSHANFILFRTKKPAAEVWQGVLDRGILIRNTSNQLLLENCLRVTVGTPEENKEFMKALSEVIER
ncbi:MAG: histidinol-phosphate transaminase [Candidatus Aquicultor secundus]|nr:histidinol-phosphate transaminase [Candidatus Aquicultor secundus]NCO66466.1 histidinol-phosphate transaminase [Solirubrobacter sp.]OIO86816.1 MAG: histidinol-phosphate transaminase [Candidatus Aquicultor secundus]